jgi:hypothetical protein
MEALAIAAIGMAIIGTVMALVVRWVNPRTSTPHQPTPLDDRTYPKDRMPDGEWK